MFIKAQGLYLHNNTHKLRIYKELPDLTFTWVIVTPLTVHFCNFHKIELKIPILQCF